MREEIKSLFKKEISDSVSVDFLKLVGFIDATISQSFKLSGDDRAEFLIKNFLNMRDFLSSEITIERTKINMRDQILSIFDDFVTESDLDLEALAEVRRKKKEKELKEEQHLQENTSENDLSTL